MTPVSCSARVLILVPAVLCEVIWPWRSWAVMLRGVTRDAQYVALAIMAALSVTTPFSLLSYSLAALALGIAALSSGTFRPQGADTPAGRPGDVARRRLYRVHGLSRLPFTSRLELRTCADGGPAGCLRPHAPPRDG